MTFFSFAASFVGLLLAPASALASTGAESSVALPLWSVAPFAALLLCIALLPLVAEPWWGSNTNKAIVALLLGVPTAVYVGLGDLHLVLHALHEYVAFILLLATLYIVSGGLVLRGDIEATPLANTGFLAIGALLANVVGTTGASMLLIRPLLRTNQQRERVRHIPVFFIFVVSNMGGMLTPLGDPPLFLGYLRGVPFFWTLRLVPVWAFGVGSVLAIFYLWDRWAHARETRMAQQQDRAERQPLRLSGGVNILFLAGVVAAVFLPSPWRELAMAAMAGLSLRLTPRELREENGFTFHPISEVAVLFAGIFLTMVPALEILRSRGGELGLTHAWQFFWTTGALSSFLDNAPTYVSFLSLAQGLSLAPEVAQVSHKMLLAISAGAVFMGANSYIGNGPNFMVKAIADEANVRTPSFFGYMGFAALVLWPVFLVTTLIFFRS